MPDRPHSTQQAVEKLERLELHFDDGPALLPLPTGQYVRFSAVLNALQEVEGEGRRAIDRVLDAAEGSSTRHRLSIGLTQGMIDEARAALGQEAA